MKKRLTNNILLIPFFVVLLLTSCRQTVIVHGAAQASGQNATIDLWGFVKDSLLDWSFTLWLLIWLMAAFLVYKTGHSMLEWFKRKPMSFKVVTIIVILAALFTVGCVSQPLEKQQYGRWFALPVAIVIGSTMVVASSIWRRYRYRITGNERLPEGFRRQRNLTLLAKVMVWIWSCGWVIFFVAIGIGKQPHVGAEVLLRSAVASLDLFWMDIDSNIIDAIQYHDVLKGMIVCTSFAAVICLAALIASLVMSRLMAWLHVRHIRVDNERNHLYVFFGIDDSSKQLAKSVVDHDEHAVVVFVENSLAGEAEQNEDKNDSWKNIVSMLTHRRKTFMDADENDRRALAIASCSVCSLEEKNEDVFGNIGLDAVKGLLKRLAATKDGELHVFFLSEDRDNNVRSTIILSNDALIGSPAFVTIIYCHALRNGINKIMEDMNLGLDKRIEVRILDSSYLAVEQIKTNVGNHPVNFVDVRTIHEDNPGSVASPFVSLVVGFNETGQEAVKFLYEYGAFVHADATPKDSRRSPFRCYVVDKNMKEKEGCFVAGIPGAKCKKSNEGAGEGLIKLFVCDWRTDEFFNNVLSQIAPVLNYVVVAIGDDEDNMSAAVEILRYVRKKRKDLDKFRIFVRVYERESFQHMEEIAQHYNIRLSKKEQKPENTIVLFGQRKNVYTYDLVVRDHYQEQGRKYYECYRSLQIDPANDEGEWDKRHQDCMKENGKTTKWERMSKIRRKESQDRSNALHAKTKIKLLEEAVGKDNARDFALRALDSREGKQDSIHYRGLNMAENELMRNLAICEHLRWNAAHEMMGYVDNTVEHRCDEITKRHNCLKPWQELDRESMNAGYRVDYKLFDYGVVETSFKLNYKDK